MGLFPYRPRAKQSAYAVGLMDKKTREARIDIRTMKEGMNLSLGDKVKIELTGKVTSLRGPEESMYKDLKGKTQKNTYPGSMCIEVEGMEVEVVGDFTGMLED